MNDKDNDICALTLCVSIRPGIFFVEHIKCKDYCGEILARVFRYVVYPDALVYMLDLPLVHTTARRLGMKRVLSSCFILGS